MLAKIRLKRIVACLVVLGIAGAIAMAPNKAEGQIGGQFVQLNQYDYSGQTCQNTKTILVDMITDDEGNIYAIYRRVIFAADCSAMMINPPGVLKKYDPEMNELWSVEIDNGSPLALALTDNYVWVLSYRVPLGAPTCKYAITRVPREGGLARTECIISGLSPFGGPPPDGLSALYDITGSQSNTDSIVACGCERVAGVVYPWMGKIEFPCDGGFNIPSQRNFPEDPGGSFDKIAADGSTVACVYSGGLIIVEEGSLTPTADTAVITTMVGHDVAVSESAGVAVVAGCAGNDADACVAVISLEDVTYVGSYAFGDPLADDWINSCMITPAQEPGERARALVVGTTDGDLFGTGQSLSGFVAELLIDEEALLPVLIGGSQYSTPGGDVRFWALGGGGQYYVPIGGTTNGTLGETNPNPNAAETSFIGIMDLRNPVQMIEGLIAKVEAMNLHQGIENSLDVKLENAKKSLESVKAGNRQDAVNKLQAFINECVAQTGQKLTVEQADEVIADADAIIAVLQLS